MWLSPFKTKALETLFRNIEKLQVDPYIRFIIHLLSTYYFIRYQFDIFYHLFIIVLDVNDNEPQFLNSPYSFSVDETVSVGDILYNSVGVRDLDTGLNGIVNITCDADLSPEACDVFEIKTRNADLVRFSTTCILLRSKIYIILS